MFIRDGGQGVLTSLKSVHMKIEVDITKPLFGGFSHKISGKNATWVQVKYERLPLFCFSRGVIGHEMKVCKQKRNVAISPAGDEVSLYGHWLKVEDSRTDCFSAVRESCI